MTEQEDEVVKGAFERCQAYTGAILYNLMLPSELSSESDAKRTHLEVPSIATSDVTTLFDPKRTYAWPESTLLNWHGKLDSQVSAWLPASLSWDSVGTALLELCDCQPMLLVLMVTPLKTDLSRQDYMTKFVRSLPLQLLWRLQPSLQQQPVDWMAEWLPAQLMLWTHCSTSNAWMTSLSQTAPSLPASRVVSLVTTVATASPHRCQQLLQQHCEVTDLLIAHSTHATSLLQQHSALCPILLSRSIQLPSDQCLQLVHTLVQLVEANPHQLWRFPQADDIQAALATPTVAQALLDLAWRTQTSAWSSWWASSESDLAKALNTSLLAAVKGGNGRFVARQLKQLVWSTASVDMSILTNAVQLEGSQHVAEAVMQCMPDILSTLDCTTHRARLQGLLTRGADSPAALVTARWMVQRVSQQWGAEMHTPVLVPLLASLCGHEPVACLIVSLLVTQPPSIKPQPAVKADLLSVFSVEKDLRQSRYSQGITSGSFQTQLRHHDSRNSVSDGQARPGWVLVDSLLRDVVAQYPQSGAVLVQAIARTFAAVDAVPAKYYVEAWDTSRRVWPFDAAVEDCFKRFPHLWTALLLGMQPFASFHQHGLSVLCSLCVSFVAAAILVAKRAGSQTKRDSTKLDASMLLTAQRLCYCASALLPYPLSQAHVFLPHVTVLQAASVVKAIGMGFAMLRVGEEGQPEVLSAFLPQLKEALRQVALLHPEMAYPLL